MLIKNQHLTQDHFRGDIASSVNAVAFSAEDFDVDVELRRAGAPLRRQAVAEPLRQPHALAPRRRLHGPVPAPPRAVPRLRGRPAERDARVEDGHVRAVDARVARVEGEVERRREHRLRSRADAVATDEVDGEGGEAQERHVPQRDGAGRGAYDERYLPYGVRPRP